MKKPPFTHSEIQDVRILVKAGGKHYAINANTDKCTKEQALAMRIEMFKFLSAYHYIVEPALEDIKVSKDGTKII